VATRATATQARVNQAEPNSCPVAAAGGKRPAGTRGMKNASDFQGVVSKCIRLFDFQANQTLLRQKYKTTNFALAKLIYILG
jgi:hypothetical protein